MHRRRQLEQYQRLGHPLYRQAFVALPNSALSPSPSRRLEGGYTYPSNITMGAIGKNEGEERGDRVTVKFGCGGGTDIKHQVLTCYQNSFKLSSSPP